MPKYRQRDTARRTLGGFGKDQIAQLGKQSGGQTQGGIGDQKRHRHHQHRSKLAGLRRHGVDQGFEQQGHTHIGYFGAHHQAQGKGNAPLVGPQIGEEALQSAPVTGLRCAANGGYRRGVGVGGGAERAHG